MAVQKNKVQLGVLINKKVAIDYRKFLKKNGLVMGKDIENLILQRMKWMEEEDKHD